VNVPAIELEPPRSLGQGCCARVDVSLSTADVDRLSELAKALSDPVRVQIVDVLRRQAGEVCVCDLQPLFAISQPTLSRALQLLEAAVGQQLLVRTPQGVHVTHAGEMMIELCKPIIAQLERLQDELSTDAGGRIAVGLPVSFNQPIAIPFVQQMTEQRPRLKLRLYEGINNNVRQWMEQGLLDFAMIISLERVPAHFDSTPLISDSLKLLGRDLEHFDGRTSVGADQPDAGLQWRLCATVRVLEPLAPGHRTAAAEKTRLDRGELLGSQRAGMQRGVDDRDGFQPGQSAGQVRDD